MSIKEAQNYLYVKHIKMLLESLCIRILHDNENVFKQEKFL
jgi:hypothetical protein